MISGFICMLTGCQCCRILFLLGVPGQLTTGNLPLVSLHSTFITSILLVLSCQLGMMTGFSGSSRQICTSFFQQCFLPLPQKKLLSPCMGYCSLPSSLGYSWYLQGFRFTPFIKIKLISSEHQVWLAQVSVLLPRNELFSSEEKFRSKEWSPTVLIVAVWVARRIERRYCMQKSEDFLGLAVEAFMLFLLLFLLCSKRFLYGEDSADFSGGSYSANGLSVNNACTGDTCCVANLSEILIPLKILPLLPLSSGLGVNFSKTGLSRSSQTHVILDFLKKSTRESLFTSSNPYAILVFALLELPFCLVSKGGFRIFCNMDGRDYLANYFDSTYCRQFTKEDSFLVKEGSSEQIVESIQRLMLSAWSFIDFISWSWWIRCRILGIFYCFLGRMSYYGFHYTFMDEEVGFGGQSCNGLEGFMVVVGAKCINFLIMGLISTDSMDKVFR